ncbi:DUF6712 family protein [Rikenella microfusus]|uniref:DUF6712 family protein n=1 Tax=Rikenella microfusus TaxID=28139 RepID=UPI00248EEEC3|nr:DUF6712 family protein [Rikenella microfusus]
MLAIDTIINVETLREYAPGVDGALQEPTIRPYLRPAHKTVALIIGIDVFNRVAEMEETPLLESLRSAVANRIMYDYKLFETIRKRQTEQSDTYKYELQAMQDTYLDYYYDALDSLIRELNQKTDIPEWTQSAACKALSSLLIRNADEFQEFYGIDSSDYFFWSSVFIQRRVMDNYLTGIDLPALEPEMLRRVKGAVATLTVAFALRQFDISMLPRSLRNPTQEGASRHAASEQEAMYKLSDFLLNQGEAALQQIVFELNRPEPGTDLPSETNRNKPRNKFFLFT